MAAKKTKTKRASSPKRTKSVPKNTAKPKPPPPPKVEITVRTVYHDGQHLPALCFRHPEPPSVQAVTGDTVSGIREIPLSVRDHDKASLISYHDTPYPPERFAAIMKHYALGGVPITSAARALLLPLAPGLPAAYAPPDAIPAHATASSAPDSRPRSDNPILRAVRAGSLRTSGKDLIRKLARLVELPTEKVRARLRAAGLRAPYLDTDACYKALGVKAK